MLDSGLIFASDSRTHAGVDNFASFCKMTLFERAGDRVIVLLSSGNLAGTQAVISLLKQRGARDGTHSLWGAESMFDAAMLVSDAMREVDRRDGQHLADSDIGFNASFILGGQIAGEPPRLFRIYAEGNFIEAGHQTPWDVFQDRIGVRRDYAHLAITFCRCMNIPARYCTGYLGDIGMPPPYGPMDFAGWFEAYLDGNWYTFDARNNMPRIGRVLIARGRDAADIAISNTFGPNTLKSFKVRTDEVIEERSAAVMR
jgi:hypothetical protein